MVGALVAGLIVVAGGIGVAVAAQDSQGGKCSAGVEWHQRPSPSPDGETVATGSPPRVVVVLGGARVGFPNPGEFSAMGYSSYRAVSASSFAAIDTVPREGTLLQERAHAGGPGRLFLSTGGAVFQITNAVTLRAIHLDTDHSVLIPEDGLDDATRVPPVGTLLRQHGSHTVWRIVARKRQPTSSVCKRAHVVELPAGRHVLGAIPVRPSPLLQ